MSVDERSVATSHVNLMLAPCSAVVVAQFHHAVDASEAGVGAADEACRTRNESSAVAAGDAWYAIRRNVDAALRRTEQDCAVGVGCNGEQQHAERE